MERRPHIRIQRRLYISKRNHPDLYRELGDLHTPAAAERLLQLAAIGARVLQNAAASGEHGHRPPALDPTPGQTQSPAPTRPEPAPAATAPEPALKAATCAPAQHNVEPDLDGDNLSLNLGRRSSDSIGRSLR